MNTFPPNVAIGDRSGRGGGGGGGAGRGGQAAIRDVVRLGDEILGNLVIQPNTSTAHAYHTKQHEPLSRCRLSVPLSCRLQKPTWHPSLFILFEGSGAEPTEVVWRAGVGWVGGDGVGCDERGRFACCSVLQRSA